MGRRGKHMVKREFEGAPLACEGDDFLLVEAADLLSHPEKNFRTYAHGRTILSTGMLWVGRWRRTWRRKRISTL